MQSSQKVLLGTSLWNQIWLYDFAQTFELSPDMYGINLAEKLSLQI